MSSKKCQCLKCQIERVVVSYTEKVWPVDMPDRPSEKVIMVAIAETLAIVAVLVANVHKDRGHKRAATDAALAALLKFRASITDEPEFIDLETGEARTVEELLATKH